MSRIKTTADYKEALYEKQHMECVTLRASLAEAVAERNGLYKEVDAQRAQTIAAEERAFTLESSLTASRAECENARETLRLVWTVLCGENYLKASGDGDLARKVTAALGKAVE